jgi:hypothetical protein
MKKAKVDSLIKRFARESFDAGKQEGLLKERSRWR